MPEDRGERRSSRPGRRGPGLNGRPSGTTFADRLDQVRLPLRLAYVGVLFLATLSWFRIDVDAGDVSRRLGRMLDPSISARDIIDGARNVLLFAGWGLLWMVTAGPGRSRVELRNAVLSGAALSLLVEVLQLFSRSRTASILDLATNTLGAALGAISLVLVVQGLAQRKGKKSFVGVPAAVFALSCGLAVAGEAFVPLFRQDIEPWARGGPMARLTEAVSRFRWGGLGEWPIGDVLLFFPAGVFAVAALSELGVSYRKAAGYVAVGGAILFALIEVGHGALGMEILGGAALVHAIAVAAGALLGARALPPFSRAIRGADRPLVLTGLYVPWILLWGLRPYSPEPTVSAMLEKLSGEWWIPLRSLGSRFDMFSVTDVIVGFCLFLPLGALLAVWPLRTRGALHGFLPALYLAGLIELSQTITMGRTLDITDFLLNAAGVTIGWTIVRRAGFRAYGSQLKKRPVSKASA